MPFRKKYAPEGRGQYPGSIERKSPLAGKDPWKRTPPFPRHSTMLLLPVESKDTLEQMFAPGKDEL